MAVKIFSMHEGENFQGLEDRVNDFLIMFEEKNIPTQVTVTNDNVIYIFHPTQSIYEKHIANLEKIRENNQKGKSWQ